MRANHFIWVTAVLLFTGCKAQPTFGNGHLREEKQIVLPGVQGRIDHMDINLKEKIVYVAALGNNTVEVVNIEDGKTVHSITGLDEPQGVGYIPQTNELVVANGGSGDCYFYNASSFEKTASIHLSSDADDVRYDSAEAKIYVGYGEGGIAVIDALTHKQVSDIVLPAHPEGFQLDKTLQLSYVNIPDKDMVGVVDLKRHKLIKEWKRHTPTANFPMAINEKSHTVYVGYRHPAKLLALDGKTGSQLGLYDIVGDTDDLYFDGQTGNLYVSGGDGYINIFKQDSAAVKLVANAKSRIGARTSLLIPSLHILVLAERADSGSPAQLAIYNTQ